MMGSFYLPKMPYLGAEIPCSRGEDMRSCLRKVAGLHGWPELECARSLSEKHSGCGLRWHPAPAQASLLSVSPTGS